MKRFLAFTLALCMLVGILAAVPKESYAMDELKNTDPDKYYIVLDLRNQFVTVYEKDENGEYTRIVRRFLCSSGSTEPEDEEDPEDIGTPTPTGIWKIGSRERFGKFANYGNEFARYWVQIVGSIYFHSIMFNRRDVDHLMSGPYGKLGTNVSHGCVRLYIEDAKWLYYYACPGTTVEVTSDTKSQRSITKALKSSLSFKEYNALQKKFFDNPEGANPYCTVTVDGARARKGCGRDYPTVFKAAIGDKLEVLQQNDVWVKVKNGAKEGYMLRGFVSFDPSGAMDTTENAKLIKSTCWMFMDTSGAKDKRICKVPTDTSVKILDDTDKNWVKIAYSGEEGYIKKNSLRTAWGKDMGN